MPADGKHPVASMLSRRGFEIIRKEPEEYLFFPTGLPEETLEELYAMLRRYSYRIFVRDIIKHRDSFTVEDLLKYSTREWAAEQVGWLLAKGIIEPERKGRYRLKSSAARSFGDTLEWLVAKVFEKELSCPALWGVRLAGAEAGGDYDCIASVEGELFYVEAKSSPPKNVEEAEVSAFIKRTEALCPAVAVFLEDTKLRMKDKIEPLFAGLLEGREIKRLWGETFSIGDRVFITNSHPDMAMNLASCVRRRLRPESFW
ncbi:MAG: hypothetical protein Q8P48_09930 [Deltaproteobacteria bacterium]|nr:hypothetical protein [Deltaproteobacteria bacterium]